MCPCLHVCAYVLECRDKVYRAVLQVDARRPTEPDHAGPHQPVAGRQPLDVRLPRPVDAGLDGQPRSRRLRPQQRPLPLDGQGGLQAAPRRPQLRRPALPAPGHRPVHGGRPGGGGPLAAGQVQAGASGGHLQPLQAPPLRHVPLRHGQATSLRRLRVVQPARLRLGGGEAGGPAAEPGEAVQALPAAAGLPRGRHPGRQHALGRGQLALHAAGADPPAAGRGVEHGGVPRGARRAAEEAW